MPPMYRQPALGSRMPHDQTMPNPMDHSRSGAYPPMQPHHPIMEPAPHMANLMMPNTSAEPNPYQLGPSNQYSGHNAPPVWGGHQHSLIDEDPMFMDRGGHGGPLMGGHH